MTLLRKLPLATRLIVLATLCVVLAAASTALLTQWLPAWAAGAIAAITVGTLAATVIWRTVSPMRATSVTAIPTGLRRGGS